MYLRPSILLSLTVEVSLVAAQYTLQKDYFQGNFFDSFNFFDGVDPTNGFVQYTGRDDSLISSSAQNAQMHVSTAPSTPAGRPSIRITSKDSYETGLIVLDLEHMPGGICGTWPAFWTFGPNWPTDGEIDIIEGVNDVQTNQVTLHTGSSCSISPSNMFGSVSTNNCDVSNGDNTGCGITTTDTATYGSAFNSNGGGVYATLLTGANIIVWFWPRNSIPSDVLSNSPNPSSWSTPLANFTGPCNFAQSFVDQNIVFDTTFCGDWAGANWPSSGCASKAATCEDYVANNGADFAEAYWSVNGLKVYQQNGTPQSSAAATLSSTSLQPASSTPSASTNSPSISSVPPTLSLTSSEATSALPVSTTFLTTTTSSIATTLLTTTTSSIATTFSTTAFSTSHTVSAGPPSSVTMLSYSPTTFVTVTTPNGPVSSGWDSTWGGSPITSTYGGPWAFENHGRRPPR